MRARAALWVALAVVVVAGLVAPVANGQEVTWVRRWSSGIAWPNTAMAVGGDRVYVTSQDWGHPWLVRSYTPDGHLVWSARLRAEIYGAAADATGVYVAGRTYARFPGQPDGQGPDAIVARFRRDGTRAWVRQFSGRLLEPCIPGDESICPDAEEVWGITVGHGVVYVTGRTWTRFAGQTFRGEVDGFVASFGQAGHRRWLRQFGTAREEWPVDVAVGTDGVYIVGETMGRFAGQPRLGYSDPFIRAYRLGGAVAWTRQFGTAVSGIDGASATTMLGDTILAAGARCCGPRDQQITLTGFAASGDQLWASTLWGSTEAEWVTDAVELEGLAVFAGATQGSFPDQRHRGQDDAILIAVASDGTLAWIRQYGSPGYDDAEGIDGTRNVAFVSGTASGGFLGTSGTPEDAFLMRLQPVNA